MRRFEPNKRVRTGAADSYHQVWLVLVQDFSKSPSSCMERDRQKRETLLMG